MISSVSQPNQSCPINSSSTCLRHLFTMQHVPTLRMWAHPKRLGYAGGVSWRTYAVRIRGAPLDSPVLLDSLRVLDWDVVCESVADFAGTSLGKDALLAQLNSLGLCYDDSLVLQKETTALVEMLKYGVGGLDFASLDLSKVKYAIDRASRGFAMDGIEIMAVVGLLQFADTLQMSVKIVVKENKDLSYRFQPLSDMILDMIVNRAFVKVALQIIDEDGSVKDTSSSELKRYRNQVRQLERKLYLLMDSFLRNATNEGCSQEVSNVEGRWCLKFSSDQTSVPGLLLRGGSDAENFVEPISAVPLNDELEQARALVVKAEQDVLFKLTQKMQANIEDLYRLLDVIVLLDMISARAKYSLAFGGTCPDLFVLESNCSSVKDGEIKLADGRGSVPLTSNHGRKWTLHLRKAYHPILLQKYKDNLQKAREDLKTANAGARRRRLQGDNSITKEDADGLVKSLEARVAESENAHPVSVDFLVDSNTKAVVITGPNTGGKTISLKTVGLAALMGKLGLYILASEPVRLPWFDSIFADIGDEQSLVQSQSTFSGHLIQINRILKQSTKDSLVLLDEVGAGTNPIEGAALGMAILECFAENRALLTMATTHHGELKSLKYSNHRFENACVEFDEVNLRPTYKILWGVPGRSNAISIAERLGLPPSILDNARSIYGSASAEINKVIIDLERFKQEFQEHVSEARHNLRLATELHKTLLEVSQKINEHRVIQRFRKMREISEAAGRARSILHSKLRQFRASKNEVPKVRTGALKLQPDESRIGSLPGEQNASPAKASESNEDRKQTVPEMQNRIPKIGEMVSVPSLARKVKVLKVDVSKEEVVVQANNMKLRLRLRDITF